MADYRAKFDAELRDIHTSFLDIQRGDRGRVYPLHSAALHGRPVSLLLQFGDDLAGIEARGFRTEWAEGHFARGDIDLADLEAVASHPEVIQLEYGSRPRPLLNTSAPEIRARATSAAPGVWAVTSAGVFSGNEGTGVLIGVIDSGIDISHPVFLKAGSTNTTRILRIWDMGIDPHDGILGPDVSLLQGNFTYGIEYTDALINDVLQKKPGSKPVKHKDCHGHGTHVASIAAGNGSAPHAKKKFEFVGVAPAAELIIVKLFFLAKDPQQNGVELPFERLLEDAISYVQRVAKNKLGDRPVVINASLGNEIGPHDGLSATERRLEALFLNASKVALVAAAGNEAGSRQHAVITMPGSGTIDVPFTLYDERTVKTDKASCDSRPNAAPELEIQFWYRLAAQQVLTCALTLPGASTAIPGPTLGNHVDGTYRGTQPFHFTHDADATQRPPATTPLTRNVLRIKVTPKGGNFGTGRFTLRLAAPVGAIINAWCAQGFPPHGFRIGHDKPRTDPPEMLPLPAGISILSDTLTLSSPATSAGAIAVAAYNDMDPGHSIADFSSQGPLADYSGNGPYVAKPDLAAPGVQITAAISGAPAMRSYVKVLTGAQYAILDGTSMATPHVSGVAALMFEKNNNLTRADLLKKLQDHARPPNQPDEFGAGRVDAKASRDAV
jgi:subtilisin family serine protease